MILTQGNRTSTFLPIGHVLTVIADADSSGQAWRFPGAAGEQATLSAAIAAGETVTLGPYPAVARIEIACAAGFLTYGESPVDLQAYVAAATAALKAEAVTPLTDETTGTPADTLAPVGDTSQGDESAAINNNFASLNAQIEALKAALVAAGLLTEYVEPEEE